MNLGNFKLNGLREVDWRIDQGNFSTWRSKNFYWHGPNRFKAAKKTVHLFVQNVDWMPTKKIWYLTGLRQHISRQNQKIKGFIPFIGIDIVNFKVVFVLYQTGPVRPDLNVILEAFLESAVHAKLKNKVHCQ